MKLYIGNLAFDVTDEDLKAAFAGSGEVASATVVKDASSGRSRGFGFVEMPNDAEAKAAIEKLNSKELKGRTIIVNQARPREAGGARGGGGRGGSGGGYRGGGGGRSSRY